MHWCCLLLDFQHLKDDKYPFLVAENMRTHEYDALIGFIPKSRFDPGLRENGDYWVAIWKKQDDVVNDETGLIGIQLFYRLFKLPGHPLKRIYFINIQKIIVSYPLTNPQYFLSLR